MKIETSTFLVEVNSKVDFLALTRHTTLTEKFAKSNAYPSNAITMLNGCTVVNLKGNSIIIIDYYTKEETLIQFESEV